MIFNELYSAYYNTVAKILSAVLAGKAGEKELQRIVAEHAFGESVLTVLPALKNEKWQLVHGDGTTPLRYPPTMPLTRIQKQWLKAITPDPRFRLFGVEIAGLEEVEPLFTAADYSVYDRYSDGDPYEDAGYIDRFQTILSALQTGQSLKLEMVNRRGKTVYAHCIPKRLEYSEKDDKFRLVTAGCPFVRTVNLARITKCRVYNGEEVQEAEAEEIPDEWILLKVKDERNALERALLHFAHFEKRAEREGEHYLLHIKYSRDDEAELVIRVLSFGPMVEVLESERFRQRIIDKLNSQKSCELL